MRERYGISNRFVLLDINTCFCLQAVFISGDSISYFA